MSDSTTAIAIVAVITGLGSAVALILKHIRHSECSSCCKIDTRTPPQTPTENKKNNTDDNIKEIQV